MEKVSGTANLPVIFYPDMHYALAQIKKAAAIEFRQEICGLTQPQIIKLAQAFLEVIKSEKDKAAQEEQ